LMLVNSQRPTSVARPTPHMRGWSVFGRWQSGIGS
jgi:hypothetical protein